MLQLPRVGNGASPDCIIDVDVVVVLDAIFAHVSDHTQNSSHAAV